VTQGDTSAVKADATATMACNACRTVSVAERRLLQGTKAGTALFTIGTKHSCSMCGGEIVTVNGKTVDTMKSNGYECGVGAAFCCVATVPAVKS